MSAIANTRVLVTGGGGFIGAPTVRALLEAGAEVRVLDVADPWRLTGLECEVLIGDVTDRSAVEGACGGVDAVVHLAVLPLNQANAEPARAFATNVLGSFNVFDAAGRSGVQRIIYASASSAYGPTDAYPISEDHPLKPISFYPASKAAAEMLLRGLAGAYGFGFLILRYMNVYGPGQRAGVIPAVAGALLDGRPPMLSGDGTQAFDFVHIEDCARANRLALESECTGESLNVGSGCATSLNAVTAELADLAGVALRPVYEGPVIPAPPRVGDVSRARAAIGFSAQVSLRDGLASVLEELRSARRAEGRGSRPGNSR
jgi:UDP-glucose 4-epimerase